MRFKHNKGQIVAAEYAVVIAVVAGMIIGMSIFFRRAVQARMSDSRDYMVALVKNVKIQNGNAYIGNAEREYEPYYLKSIGLTTTNRNETEKIIPGANEGTFYKEFNEVISVNKNSILLPPKDWQ